MTLKDAEDEKKTAYRLTRAGTPCAAGSQVVKSRVVRIPVGSNIGNPALNRAPVLPFSTSPHEKSTNLSFKGLKMRPPGLPLYVCMCWAKIGLGVWASL